MKIHWQDNIEQVKIVVENLSNADNIKEWSLLSRDVLDGFGDEGDAARQYILNPVLFDLLDNVKDRSVLDAGCGTGYLCRLLAKKGAKVTGVEPALPLFEYALELEQKNPLGIDYACQDLSQYTDAVEAFDVVVSNMVFMDIPEYSSAMRNCIQSLRVGGQFVFSILHPCFDEIDSGGFEKGYRAKGYIRIDEYLNEFIIQQAVGSYIHRPLSAYLNFLINEGCRINRIVEPTLSEEGVIALGEQDQNLRIPNFIVIEAFR